MKNKLLTFMIILIATGLVLYFSLKDDYQTIINIIFSINKIWLLVSVALLFGYYLLRSYTFYKFAHEFEPKYKYSYALRLVLETNFFHAVTPFSTGGQPYEMYALNKRNIKTSDAISISLENFIVYQIALVLLGLIAVTVNYFMKIINGSFLKNLIILGFVINTLVIVILLFLALSKKTEKNIVSFFINILGKLKLIKKPKEREEKFHQYLTDFNKSCIILFKNKRRFIWYVICYLIALICLYLIPLTLFKGVDVDIKIYESIVIMAYVMLIGSFVPIPGGTGGLEYGFIAFFSKLIATKELNAIMLIWRFITYYLGMILGAIILNFKRRK